MDFLYIVSLILHISLNYKVITALFHSSQSAACNENKIFKPSKIMISLTKTITASQDVHVHICSGVLLNANSVLSTKTCMRKGELGTDRPDSAVEMWKIDKYLNEHIDAKGYPGSHTPIESYLMSALHVVIFKLELPIPESPDVKFARLPRRDMSGYFYNFCPYIYAMGWGLSLPVQFLQCIIVRKISDKECKRAYKSLIEDGKVVYDKNTMFCTTSIYSKVDLGSALVCDGYMVFALTSESTYSSLPQINYRLDRELEFIEKSLGIPRMRSGSGLRSIHLKLLTLLTIFICQILN